MGVIVVVVLGGGKEVGVGSRRIEVRVQRGPAFQAAAITSVASVKGRGWIGVHTLAADGKAMSDLDVGRNAPVFSLHVLETDNVSV